MSVTKGFSYGFGGALGVGAAIILVVVLCLLFAASRVRDAAQSLSRQQTQQVEER